VATVVYSARSLEQIERALEAISRDSNTTTPAAAEAIRSGIDGLSRHPLLGRRVHKELRELVISHGATGYLALYRFVVPKDEVRVLALRRQRDLGFIPD
jgi:plasmid stabilization system protein ParE